MEFIVGERDTRKHSTNWTVVSIKRTNKQGVVGGEEGAEHGILGIKPEGLYQPPPEGEQV